MNNNTYIIAGILFIISLPILLIWSIATIVQELRSLRRARVRGEVHTWNRAALLSAMGAMLFVLASSACILVYLGMSYHALPSDLFWLVVVLGVVALLAGVLYISQRLNKSSAYASPHD